MFFLLVELIIIGKLLYYLWKFGLVKKMPCPECGARIIPTGYPDMGFMQNYKCSKCNWGVEEVETSVSEATHKNKGKEYEFESKEAKK